MFQPHERELGIATTVSTTWTFPYLCIPQCHGEVSVFWTPLGDIGTSEPVAHDQVTPAHLSISLGLLNPSYTLHQGISNISPLLTVDLDHYTIWRAGKEYSKQETTTTQKLRPNIGHGKFRDLEKVQYNQLEEGEGGMAKDKLEQ